jgi:ATP/maltotriose-dependent transcriptional regulator MalT/DNA-binding SARP family transcriptional activator
MAVAVGAVRLERPELSERIRRALDGGPLLLIADAGFGKTAALEDALAGPTAWVRCGDADGDPGRLLDLILTSVRAAMPGAADVLAERVLTAREPVDPQLAIAALDRELEPLLVDPLTIVLDDAEALDGAPAAIALLGRLLAGRASLLRTATAARHPLALPLARARAAGRLTEIGPADLAFSVEECAEYLRVARHAEPSADEVDALVTATSGWPLGVALAAHGDPRRPGPSRELADAYFEEEVLAPLDSELRHAILAAAVAPDLEVAEAAGLGPAEGLASAAQRHGLFLLGGEPRRFHPLFRELLRARFERELAPAERQAVHAQIAAAIEARSGGPAAVSHWLEAQDWDAASAAIGREGMVLARTAPDTVQGWLDALPADYRKRPDLLLLAGTLALGAGRLEAGVELSRAAVDAFDAALAQPFLRFASRFALLDALVAVGDLAGAAALGDALDDPDAPGDIAACAVGIGAGAVATRMGQFESGRALTNRALSDPASEPLRPAIGALDGYYFDLPQGRLDDALARTREAATALQGFDPFGRLPYVLFFLVAIHEERGEDEQALAVAAQARERAARAGLAGWVGVGTTIRAASIRALMGDVSGAERDLAQVPPEWRAWGAWDMAIARAAVAASLGDSQRVRAEAEQALHAIERWPYFDATRCAAVLAPLLVRAGHPERARTVVEETLAARIPGVTTARLHAVLAWLLHEEGDEDRSVAELALAWHEAGAQARHLVRREWPRLERPLWVALEHEAIDAEAAVAALPDGDALGAFTRHPSAAVRRAAVIAAGSSGHPDALVRVGELAADPDARVAAAARAAGKRLSTEPPPLSFRVLGGFELRRGSWRVEDSAWERRVAARLVRLLLCRGEAVPEDELFEAFWPDKAATSARRGLQVAISSARAVLDPPGADSGRLEAGERTYRLRLRESDRVDAFDYMTAAAAALGAPASDRRTALSAAAALWGGEPLPEERYADWAIPFRERLSDTYVEVLAALSDAHAAAGDAAAAADAARRMVEADPLNESAHARLIVAYARAGRRGHALRQFLACRRALVTGLGVEPGEEIAALHRRVLAGEPV